MQDSFVSSAAYAFFGVTLVATIIFMSLMIRHEFQRRDK